MGNSISWYVIGGLSILAGLIAMFNPVAATLAAEKLAGWGFLLVGLLQCVVAFRQTGWKARLWAAVVGVAFFALGVLLLANPLAGIVSLTILSAAMLFVAGFAKIILSNGVKDRTVFWVVVASGTLSILLGFLIVLGLPGTLAVTLGLFLSVELISNGVSMLSIGKIVSQES